MDNSIVLREYQLEAIEYISSLDSCLLVAPMRVGKTAIILSTIPEHSKVLVIAPATIRDARIWENEAERLGRVYDFTVISFNAMNDTEYWSVKKPICPYSNNCELKVSECLHKKRKRNSKRAQNKYLQEWDYVVLEEEHGTSGRKSTWASAVVEIAKYGKKRIALTATPIRRATHELFVVLQFLFPDEAKAGGRFGSFWRFVSTYFGVTEEVVQNADGKDVYRAGKAVKQKVIGDLRVPYDQFLNDCFRGHFYAIAETARYNPQKIVNVNIKLNRINLAAYYKLMHEWKLDLQANPVECWSEPELRVNLMKCASDIYLLDQTQEPGGKVLWLMKYGHRCIEKQKKGVVLGYYRSTTAALIHMADELGWDYTTYYDANTNKVNNDNLAAFMAGKYQFLIGSVDKIAEGKNLSISDTMVIVEQSQDPIKNQQLKQRLRMIDSDKETVVCILITQDTKDAKKNELLKEGKYVSDQLLFAMTEGEQ